MTLMTTSDEESYIRMLADAFEINQAILMDDWHLISAAAREKGYIADIMIMDRATTFLARSGATSSRINEEAARIIVRMLIRQGIMQ